MAQISFSGKRELRWLEEGDCMITFIEGDIALSDALWDEWLKAFVRSHGKKRMVTSWGDIQPTKEQWKRATRTMRDSGCKVAVVTESRPTSALAKAASWAGVDMQAFRWEQLYEAGVFLGVEGTRRAIVRATVATLRDCFGVIEGAMVKRTPAVPIALGRPATSPSPAARPAATSAPAPRATATSAPVPRATATSAPVPRATATSGPSSSRSSGPSRTPMADAAEQNLAQVRQTSEEIQAKLAEVQARLRNRMKT